MSRQLYDSVIYPQQFRVFGEGAGPTRRGANMHRESAFLSTHLDRIVRISLDSLCTGTEAGATNHLDSPPAILDFLPEGCGPTRRGVNIDLDREEWIHTMSLYSQHSVIHRQFGRTGLRAGHGSQRCVWTNSTGRDAGPTEGYISHVSSIVRFCDLPPTD
jgi:hypothetical protein